MKNVIVSFCASENLLVIDSFVCLFVCCCIKSVRFRMEKCVIFYVLNSQVCSFFSSFGFLTVLRSLNGGYFYDTVFIPPPMFNVEVAAQIKRSNVDHQRNKEQTNTSKAEKMAIIRW